ncbi:MAG: hydrogenase/urease maturation nickel metallochaperone HypA [Sulfolobales archaeon]
MHEYSVAEGIVLSIKSLMREEGLSEVSEVTVSVGDLAQIDKEVLLELLKILSSEYGLGNVKYVIVSEETTFKCNYCGFSWSWSSVKDSILKDLCGDIVECDNPVHFIPDLINVFMKCPNCGSQDYSILTGYDVRLVSIKGVK